MKITPLGDRVLVERSPAVTQTAGGVFIPTSGQEKPSEGVVKALGEGRLLDDGTRLGFDVKVGDRVSFSSYSGTEVKVEGQEYIILREEDILGIFVEKEETDKLTKSLKAGR